MYARQLTILSINPFPESMLFDSDETPPSFKKITINTNYTNFYRWGIKGGKTGNHRIIYAIHNYHKVVLIHYFNKQYNGLIRQEDILPAEKTMQIIAKLIRIFIHLNLGRCTSYE